MEIDLAQFGVYKLWDLFALECLHVCQQVIMVLVSFKQPTVVNTDPKEALTYINLYMMFTQFDIRGQKWAEGNGGKVG